MLIIIYYLNYFILILLMQQKVLLHLKATVRSYQIVSLMYIIPNKLNWIRVPVTQLPTHWNLSLHNLSCPIF